MENIPFGVQLYTLAMYEVEYVEKNLKHLKLDKHQFLYLMIPSIFPGIVQTVVAQYFNVNKSTSFRMISKLVSKNYLRKEKSTNERDFNIYLTDEGKKIVDIIFDMLSNYEKKVAEGTTEPERFFKTFTNVFNHIKDYRYSEIKKRKGERKNAKR